MKAVEAVKVKFYCIYNTVGEPDYHNAAKMFV